MAHLSGLGIGLTLVFGCLLLALVGELYYLLWWKKQIITNCNSNNSNSNRIEENYSNRAKEMFYLFCWDKPNANPNPNPNPIGQDQNDIDLETGLGSVKDMKPPLGEEAMDTELMRMHNLGGPPRFLFTIKEESKEDLESEDGKSIRKGSRTRSLSDLIVALDSPTPFLSPMTSPTVKGTLNNMGHNYSNPLFESSVEADLFRLRSSPPPKFKFLRDAEEKLYRKLIEEAQKVGILEKGILVNSHLEDEKHGVSQMLKTRMLMGNSSEVALSLNC